MASSAADPRSDAATVAARVGQVRARIRAAAEAAGRDPAAIGLVAVAKTRPAADVGAAAAAGVRDVGENYLQEALEKRHALADQGLVWHFIGALQSNKTRAVAEHFDWVHTIDREKLASRLSAQRPAGAAPLQVCLQVDLDGEAGKAGVAPDDVLALAEAVVGLPGLALRGLMAIPAPRTDPAAQREPFRRLAELLAALRTRLPEVPLDTLSMGMSADLEAAVAEGATLVRIGTDVFGARASAGAPTAT